MSVSPASRARSARAVVAVMVAVMVAGPVFTLAHLCSGCVRGESLVGTWTSAEQGETIEFRSDGGGALVTAGGVVVPLTWEASGAELVLGVQGGGTKTVAYSLKGGVLTLTSYGEEPAIYTRVETTER